MRPIIASTIVALLLTFAFSRCTNSDPDTKVIKKVGDHVIIQHFNNGRLDMEAMAKPARNGKYIPDGFCKLFDSSGHLTMLSFAHGGNFDSARNTYIYTTSGELDGIGHDRNYIEVEGYHRHVAPWRSDLYHTNLYRMKMPDSTVLIRCNFRNFKNVSAKLGLKILKDDKVWFDTLYDMGKPVTTDDYPDASLLFKKKIAEPGKFVCLTRYTLTDYPSGVFVTEDTNITPLVFFR